MTTDAEVNRLLTVQDLAHRLNLPVSWIYAKAEAHELPHRKLGRYLRFDPQEIERYLEAQRQGPRA